MHSGDTSSRVAPSSKTARPTLLSKPNGGAFSHLFLHPLRFPPARRCPGAEVGALEQRVVEQCQQDGPDNQQQQAGHVAGGAGGSVHGVIQRLLTNISAQQCMGAVNLGFNKDLEAHYSVEDTELGKGGNGAVKLVTDIASGQQYACKSIIKVLGEGYSDTKRSTHLESIRREVSVLAKLKGCLNVVELHDVFEDDTHVHIIMEWCKGGELWHRIGDRHYSERTVASYMRGVLRTLAVMHSHHILHRDVKPGNFMLLSDSGSAPLKAIDFGLAMSYEPDSLPRTDLGLEGTPWYMAPEALSADVTPACDVWAAGVMAYQLLTGKFPFDDKRNRSNPAVSAIWKSVLSDPLELDKPCWADISPEAKDFVRRLLDRDVSKRPSAKEALEHPWLRGTVAERSTGKKLARSVVQRIQRYAQGSVFKRTVLQSITSSLLSVETTDADPLGFTISAGGGPWVEDPKSAALEPLYHALHLDTEESVSSLDVGSTLQGLGFRLDRSEMSRLIDQVDVAGTGQVAKAALAASQMDWRELQQSHSGKWLDMAQAAFSSLDTDHDGVLRAGDIAELLHGKLSEDRVQKAVEEAMEEAGQRAGSQAMDFADFVQMLRVGSFDTLDMYDERIDGSTHLTWNGSVSKLNELLQQAPGSPGAQQGLYKEAGVQDHALTGSARASGQAKGHQGAVADKPAVNPSSFFRFDVAPPPKPAVNASSFFRFDVVVPRPAAPVPVAPDTAALVAEQADIVHWGSGAARDLAGMRPGRDDRCHHGSTLYKNGVL